MQRRAGWIACAAIVLSLQGCGGSDAPSAPTTHTVGGAASGLTGSGLILTLNGAADLAVGGTGSFTFATPVATGTSYLVAVKTQPVNPYQTCVVTNGSGTVSGAPVANVSVACNTNTYPVGGTVSGLTGTGLVLSLNGSIDLPVAGNGAFTFPGELASGVSYGVTIRTQPAGQPFQTCVATPASGVIGAGAPNVAVSCTNDAFTVGGTVTGLTGTGLTLELNGAEELAVASSGSFVFPSKLLRGTSYTVTVTVQTGTYRELCSLSGASGASLQADVTTIKVDCGVVSGFLYVVGTNSRLLLYGIRPETGALLPMGPVGEVGPSRRGSARTPDGRTLYVSDFTSSRIYPFTVNQAKGTLTPLGTPVATGGDSARADNLAMAPSGKFLYVSNIGAGEVVKFSVDPATGSLSAPVQVASAVVYAGDTRQDIGITPDGAFLYVLSFQSDISLGLTSSLSVYAVDATTGALTARSTIAPGAASGLTIDPLGRFLYLRQQLYQVPFGSSPGAVYPYSIDPVTGALAAVGSGITVPSSNARELRIDPAGGYAYLLSNSNGTPADNRINTFSIDQSTGALSVLGAPVLIPGNPGNGFAIDPTGAFLFTLNERPAGTFDPGITSYDGSTLRITRTGPNTGQLSDAGNGAGVGNVSSVIVVVP